MSSTMMLLVVLVGTVLAIAWILLPFAMFGMKPLLRQLLAEQQRTNELLRALAEKRDQ